MLPFGPVGRVVYAGLTKNLFASGCRPISPGESGSVPTSYADSPRYLRMPVPPAVYPACSLSGRLTYPQPPCSRCGRSLMGNGIWYSVPLRPTMVMSCMLGLMPMGAPMSPSIVRGWSGAPTIAPADGDEWNSMPRPVNSPSSNANGEGL